MLKGKGLPISLFFLALPYIVVLLFLSKIFLAILFPSSVISLLVYLFSDHEESVMIYPKISAVAKVVTVVMSIMGMLGGLIGWALIYYMPS